MSGGGAGATLPAGAGAGGMTGALSGGAAAGGAMGGASGGMAGGWQMPPTTGGTQNLYAAPGAQGAMDPGAPAQQSWLALHPKAQQALLQFGQQLMQRKQQQQGMPPGAFGAMAGRPMAGGALGGLPGGMSGAAPPAAASDMQLTGPPSSPAGNYFGGQIGDPNTYAPRSFAPSQANMPAIGRMSNAIPSQDLIRRMQAGGAMGGGAAGGGMMGGGGPFWGGSF